jgi:protein-disulfide isomerase
MCSACKRFEEVNAETIDGALKDGTVQLELHPMTFLDSQSRGTRYSTRAASALGTVGDMAPDKVWHFYAGLYAHQPAEGSTGLKDSFIAEIAETAGVPKNVIDRFEDEKFAPWAKASNDAATKAGVTSTPTVLLNGVKVEQDLTAEGALATAIQEAAAKKASPK